MKAEKAQREYEIYSSKVTSRDVADVLEKEQSVLKKVKGPLKRFTEDFELLFAIVTEYVHGTYKAIPWTAIAGIVGTLLYVFVPADVIPDWIPLLGLTDDASVMLFCIKAIDAELQKYKQWKEAQTVAMQHEPYTDTQKKITMTVTLSDVDYKSLSESVIELFSQNMEKKNKKSVAERLFLFFKKPVRFIAPKIIEKVSAEKLDETALKYANENKQTIINALQKSAQKYNIAIKIDDVEFTNRSGE